LLRVGIGGGDQRDQRRPEISFHLLFPLQAAGWSKLDARITKSDPLEKMRNAEDLKSVNYIEPPTLCLLPKGKYYLPSFITQF
jgi:hypothetical protein